jgi:osmotically-inducible protein OsmY
MTHPFRSITFLACVALGLTGCAAVLLGGAAGGARVAADARTTGSFVEDQAIEMKAGRALETEAGLAQGTRINVYSYNQQVLLTGQAHNEADHARVLELVRGIDRVRLVRDYITVGPASGLGQRGRDTLLEAQVRTELIRLEDFDFTRVSIIGERGVIYLMGLVDQNTGRRAAEAAARVRGVSRVVNLFEYTDVPAAEPPVKSDSPPEPAQTPPPAEDEVITSPAPMP